MGALGAARGRSSRAYAAVAVIACALVASLLLLASPALAQQRSVAPILAQGAGMAGPPSPAVRGIQRALLRHGYDLGRTGVDGRFGPITARAVRRMQSKAGITVDGVVGPRTREAIRDMRHTTRRAAAERRHASKVRRIAPKPAPAAAPRPVSATAGERGTGWLLPAAGASAALGACLAGLWLLGTGSMHRRRRGAPAGRRTKAGRAGRAPVWTAVPSWLEPGDPVIGYVTLSPGAQGSEAEGPAQVIEHACDRAGWELVEVVTDREAGRGLHRPGLRFAVEQIAEGNARGLVIDEVQRVTRSPRDLGALIEWFRDADAALVALDLGLDTSTIVGQEAADRLVTLGRWERRTQPALAAGGAGTDDFGGQT
jgi:putative peptidoglycan binding protein/resolvase-like protein